MRLTALLVLLAALLLPGCSVTRFAYDNADVYLGWQANKFFDFQGEQGAELDKRIDAFLAWHRARELPEYARFTEDMGARIRRGLRREDLEWGYDSVRTQIGEALGAAAAEMAELLDRLEPAQIANLEQRFADENRKFAREQLQGTVDERRQRRYKRNLERLEEWFGSFSDAQAERLRRYGERAPLGAELRDQDRKRRQREFVEMLRAREAKARLAKWAQAWETDRAPDYAARARATREEYIALLLDLDKLLEPAQRERAAARMRRYAELFDSMARQ